MASLGHGDEAIAVFKEVHGSDRGVITFDEYLDCVEIKLRAPHAIDAT